MSYEATEHARQPMERRVTWYCDQCEHTWLAVEPAVALGPFHEGPLPDCPECQGAPQQIVRAPSVKTNASRAVDFAQQMAEQDYGLTDMKDNTQSGESVIKGPAPVQTAESEAMTRELLAAGAPESIAPQLQEQAKSFFSGSIVSPQANPITQAIPQTLDAARAMAAPGVQASRGLRADPLGLLHEAGKKGLDPTARQNLRNYSKSPAV